MKDLLTKLSELEKDLQVINESTDPLAETASMNISMTGDSADEVAQLVQIMRTGGELSVPKAPEAPPMNMPMDKAISIMKPPMDMDGPTDSPMDDMPRHEDQDWANSPDEQYADTQTMTHDLAGGINRTKSQHAPAADGDNPMAVEGDKEDCMVCKDCGDEMHKPTTDCSHDCDDESGDWWMPKSESSYEAIEAIKNELYAALREKSKPDFPDLDNDGDKEEPMSQAIAQRDGEDDDDEDTNEAMEEDEVKAILDKHPEAAAALKQGSDIMDHDDLYGDLYSYFANSGDMPYDTQKARDGDPYEWVHNKLDDLGFIGGEDESSEVNGDTTYSISGKTAEADAELARIAKNAGQAQEETMKDRDAYSADEKAKPKKDVTLPKAPCDKKDDDEDKKDEATLEHEETLRAIRAVSFR